MMKEKVEFNKIGLITYGAYEGWYVLVEDDTPNTGGYYVFISNSPNVKGAVGSNDGAEGYDNWFENKEQINSYFERNNWSIEWK